MLAVALDSKVPEPAVVSVDVLPQVETNIETSNAAFHRYQERTRIQRAICFIEEACASPASQARIWNNLIAPNKAVVLDGLAQSDLRTICQDLQVGGFGHLSNNDHRYSCTIFDNVVAEAYLAKHPTAEIINTKLAVRYVDCQIGVLEVISREDVSGNLACNITFNASAPEPWASLKVSDYQIPLEIVCGSPRLIETSDHFYGFLRSCTLEIVSPTSVRDIP